MSKPFMEVTIDNTKEFNKIISRFKSDDVVVGIPMSDKPRQGESINNATILAMNEFGSPANNIPPRPVMSIGLKNCRDQISEEFRKAALGAFTQGVSALVTYYNRAGIIASNSVKKAINSQEGIDPPSDATIAARKAKGFSGEKALLVTAQLRNAITYVVRQEWRK